MPTAGQVVTTVKFLLVPDERDAAVGKTKRVGVAYHIIVTEIMFRRRGLREKSSY